MSYFIRALTWINLFSIIYSVNIYAEEPEESISDLADRFSDGEYAIIRYLEENPIDPRKADIEDLLDIPGFTRALARRVIAAVNKSKGDSQWILFLSSEDRRKIHKYKRILMLPSVRNYDLSLRYTRSDVTNLDNNQDDRYIHLESDRANLLGRIRSGNGTTEVTGYAIFNLLNKQLRVYTGDFLPDFAMGLVARGQSFYYPFSYRYPLNKYRWISRGNYFYGKVIRGMAVDYEKYFFRSLVYNGRIREYDDGKFDFSNDTFKGGRAEVKIGESKIGVSIVEEGGSIPEYYTGIDSRFKKGNLDLGFEMAISPGGGRAISCAGKIKSKKTKTGLIIYDVNRLYSNLLGKIPADGRKVKGEQRGVSAVVERELSRRFYLRCSIERWTNRRSYSLANKLSLRFQLIKKLKRKKVRLEWKYSENKTVGLVPRKIENISGANTLKFLFTSEPGVNFRFRNSIMVPWGEGYLGYLIVPSVRFLFLDGHIKGDFSLALYKALEGNPIYYCYQPSVKGSFAWKYLSGSGMRGVCGLEISWKNTIFHTLFSVDSTSKIYMTIQLIMEL